MVSLNDRSDVRKQKLFCSVPDRYINSDFSWLLLRQINDGILRISIKAFTFSLPIRDHEHVAEAV